MNQYDLIAVEMVSGFILMFVALWILYKFNIVIPELYCKLIHKLSGYWQAISCDDEGVWEMSCLKCKRKHYHCY